MGKILCAGKVMGAIGSYLARSPDPTVPVYFWLVGYLFWVKWPFETVFQSISSRLPERE